MGYIKEFRARDIDIVTSYENMNNKDRELFFKAYDYRSKDGNYILKRPRYLDKMYNKEQVIE